MIEHPDEREKRLLRELEGKNIAHYSVLLQSWIDTRMERDKTLVGLSSGGIALLFTIITTVGTKSVLESILFMIAFFGFGICIWSSLKIYQLNSEKLENEIREENIELNLKPYDKISFSSFLVGAICLCLIGIIAAATKFV